MEKLTFIEIIDKLITNCENIESFALDDTLLYNIKDYPEALEAEKIRKEFSEKHNWKYNDENYIAYINLPNEHHIAKKLCKHAANLEWEEIERYGGEGKGNTWYCIKYFPKHDVYIKVEGFYQSYEGVSFYDGWNSCIEVYPAQETITVFKKKYKDE